MKKKKNMMKNLSAESPPSAERKDTSATRGKTRKKYFYFNIQIKWHFHRKNDEMHFFAPNNHKKLNKICTHWESLLVLRYLTAVLES